MKRSSRALNVILVLLIVLTIIVYSALFYISYSKPKTKNKVNDKTKVVEKNTKEEYNLSLFMVGDALIHSNIYLDARDGDSYNFKPMLENIKPISSGYDLAYYNQETILGGVELGLSNYPRFNSPTEVGDAFIDAGFDIVSLATNHTMDKGESGVINSLSYWNSKEDIVKAGQYLSFEDRDKVRIYEKNGIKYAFFSYTTWTNGLETPGGKEYLNNVYSDELAANDIERVRDKVDVVIVAMHWGTEYSLGVDDDQERIANYLSSLGVDIIIGAHPHVVEPITYIGKTLVIYSLGNFISDQEGIERLTGLMVAVNIKKTVNKDNTVIELNNLKADLVYTKSRYGREFKLYPYSSLNNVILPNYMEYYEKYKNVVSSLNSNVEFTSLGG